MQAAQAAARARPPRRTRRVPDGLAEGGLKVDTNSLTAGWQNARPLDKATGQKIVDGRTVVSIEQTGERAILNWETFNVGRNTTVEFHQQADWAVLNRVNDPQARPSQIQGQIKADGTVMIRQPQRRGVQGHQPGRHAQPRGGRRRHDRCAVPEGAVQRGQGSGYVPTFANDLVSTATTTSFGNATGDVVVEAGARIAHAHAADA